MLPITKLKRKEVVRQRRGRQNINSITALEAGHAAILQYFKFQTSWQDFYRNIRADPQGGVYKNWHQTS